MEFRELLRRIPSRRGSCRRRRFRRIASWIKRIFGVRPHHEVGHRHSLWMEVAFGKADPRGQHDHGDGASQDHTSHSLRHHESLREFPIRKFIKAAKRIRRANQKLVAFERGFISEGGIKDREWYKHLGVAPGLWLGALLHRRQLSIVAYDWNKVMGPQHSLA